MARRSSKHVDEDVEPSEVDAFHMNKDKLLLDEAGSYGANNSGSESDEEEEVMGNEFSEDDDSEQEGSVDQDGDEELDEGDEEHQDDDVAGWGGRNNYYGGDDVSDDDEEMVQEALKQQKKHLQELSMDDYIDEEMQQGWQAAEERTKEEETKSLFVISKENNVEGLDDSERLALLNQLFPEFVPMLKELTSLKQKLVAFSVGPSNELVELKKTALSSYLGALSSYFALFVDNLKSNNTFTTMKDNEVMETILSCREVWRQANELPDEPTQVHTQPEELSQPEEQSEVSDDEEVSEDMEEEFVDASETPAVDDEDEFNIDTTAARKIKKVSKKDINDFTETVGPEDVDMEDKQRRKKTLRFYTSKIDQAATKNRDKLTGDADLPYRERLFERQQRLIEEARKRGLGQDSKNLGADLDDNDVGSDDERLAGEINENDIEYYESLKQSKAQEKALRRENHEKAVKAAKEGKLAELQEELGADGKRAINYQILKNKGLTPHRKKEYRNSRVKKRKQYEKAQKKLKSVRQVYTGENRGPYEGEKTGIKKNLSRSVKLV